MTEYLVARSQGRQKISSCVTLIIYYTDEVSQGLKDPIGDYISHHRDILVPGQGIRGFLTRTNDKAKIIINAEDIVDFKDPRIPCPGTRISRPLVPV
jgi:hypothetical protein